MKKEKNNPSVPNFMNQHLDVSPKKIVSLQLTTTQKHVKKREVC